MVAHLRKNYTNPLADISLSCLGKPNRSHPPEEKFDNSPLKLDEIKDFVRKARAKINRTSYKLYKRCPKILTLLRKLLQEAHGKKFLAKSWELADGIHIPKEKDPRKQDQFRPISLLNDLYRCHCEEDDEIRDKQYVCQNINIKDWNSRVTRLYWTHHYVMGPNKNGQKIINQPNFKSFGLI